MRRLARRFDFHAPRCFAVLPDASAQCSWGAVGLVGYPVSRSVIDTRKGGAAIVFVRVEMRLNVPHPLELVPAIVKAVCEEKGISLRDDCDISGLSA